MWQTISHVASGLTLAAFVVAAAIEALRRRLLTRERQLEATPPEDRAAAVQTLNDAFLIPSLPIDPKALSADQQYTLLLQQIRDRSKRFSVSSILVLCVAVIAGILTGIALLQSPSKRSEDRPPAEQGTLPILDRTQQAPPVVVITTSVPEEGHNSLPAPTPSPRRNSMRSALTPVGPTPIVGKGGHRSREAAHSVVWSTAEDERYGFGITYGVKGNHEYCLIVHVGTTFRTARFNTPQYLRSLSDVGIRAMTGEDGDQETNLATVVSDIDRDERLEWAAQVVFAEQPAAQAQLQLTFGPRSTVIDIGELGWQPKHYTSGDTSELWYRAQKTVDLLLDDPDWAVVQEVQLVPGVNGNTSLFEITIANYAPEPKAIGYVYIYAEKRRSSTDSCAAPDSPQQIIVRWGKVVAGEADGATTSLAGVTVPVPVRFRPYGHCSDYSLTAAVPISGMVPARSVERLVLRINEIPAMGFIEGARERKGAVVPEAGQFARFERIVVGIRDANGKAVAYPESSVVRRPLSIQDAHS